jgi:hypothetical protein
LRGAAEETAGKMTLYGPTGAPGLLPPTFYAATGTGAAISKFLVSDGTWIASTIGPVGGPPLAQPRHKIHHPLDKPKDCEGCKLEASARLAGYVWEGTEWIKL